MTKLIAKQQQVFGALLSPTGPIGPTGLTGYMLVQFGSLSNGIPIPSNDEHVIQGFTGLTGPTGLDTWGKGFSYELINGAPPAIEDIDSLNKVITRQILYWYQNGPGEWNTFTTYQTGSLVKDLLGNVWVSVADSNLNNVLGAASAQSAHWMIYKSINITPVTTSAYVILISDSIIDINYNAVGGTLILPEANATNSGRHIVINNSNATNTIALSATNGSLIDLAATYTLVNLHAYEFISVDNTWERIG